jgi:radical SAM superfamily enzyme YgiQ (UPF0313 family)
MRILLIYPDVLFERINREDVAVPPIGIYYVGALLRANGYEVEILNGPDFRGRPDAVERIIDGWKPDVIGFSVLNANRWGAIDCARIAKRIRPDVRIVFGGIGATFLWDQLLRNVAELDYVVLGEGERTFLELMNCIKEGREAEAEYIKGIGFLKQGTPVKTPDAPHVEDPDSLPNPAQYFKFNHVAATRGCAMNCSFCGSPRFWGRKVRAHSPLYFVKQLELLYKKGVTFFYFSDDTFTADRKRVIAISKLIIERDLQISWFAIARVDHVDREMLQWMRRAGCIQISYGIESGSKEIRKRLNKPLREDTIERAFSTTTGAGILPRAYFIYGSPGETMESINKTLELIGKIKPLAAIFYILELFPGTGLYEDMKREGLLTDDVWIERIESIPYFKLDESFNADRVLSWGKKFRDGFHRELGSFALALDPGDCTGDAAGFQADFLSRLALTFSHGDYSKVDEIQSKDRIAETLFHRALQIYPDHRAFWGLSILLQKASDHRGAVRLLKDGLSHYPGSEQLSLSMGISLMNLGKFDEALSFFSRFPDSMEAGMYAEKCRDVLSREVRP